MNLLLDESLAVKMRALALRNSTPENLLELAAHLREEAPRQLRFASLCLATPNQGATYYEHWRKASADWQNALNKATAYMLQYQTVTTG